MTTAEQLTMILNPPNPKASNGFTPSPYQQAIFDSVRQGTDGPDLFVSAVAGSGKTTTIVQAARFIDAPGLFAAFNVAIVDELNRRLDGTQMSAINFHKIGKRALDRHIEPRVQVDRRKYLKLARAWVTNTSPRRQREPPALGGRWPTWPASPARRSPTRRTRMPSSPWPTTTTSCTCPTTSFPGSP